MKELSDRLRLLDSKCKECQDREKEAVKEKNEWRQKYENGTTELQSLRGWYHNLANEKKNEASI